MLMLVTPIWCWWKRPGWLSLGWCEGGKCCKGCYLFPFLFFHEISTHACVRLITLKATVRLCNDTRSVICSQLIKPMICPMKINYQIKIFDTEILGTLSKQYGLWFVQGYRVSDQKLRGHWGAKLLVCRRLIASLTNAIPNMSNICACAMAMEELW